MTLHVFLKATASGTVTDTAEIAPSDSHTDTDLTNNAVSQDITVQ